MNSSSQFSKHKKQSQIDKRVDFALIKSSLLRRLFSLTIGQKVDLIPWFSFGGLIIVLGAGGFWLNRSLRHQLTTQAIERLDTKSQILGELISPDDNSEGETVQSNITALTESQEYTSVYLQQPNGNMRLIASSLASQGVNPKILELSAAAPDQVIKQVERVGDRSFYLVAQTFNDDVGRPIGVLIHGSCILSTEQVLISSLLAHTIAAIIILIVIIYLSKIFENAIAQPIQNLQNLAQDFANGNMNIRAAVNTRDEVGLLGHTFNNLADSIKTNESRLRQEAESSHLLQEIALEISESTDKTKILEIAVAGGKRILKSDRVIYLSYDREWPGTVLAESVDSKYPVALHSTMNDPCFTESFALKFQQGYIRAIANIYQAGLKHFHLQILESWAVIAMLITPVFSHEQLIGFLIAHQCDQPRAWAKNEINFLTQIGSQVGISLEKAELFSTQRQAEQQARDEKEILQRRVEELFMEVEPLSQGDLTVQVKVSEDKIGTIADSYNATIKSLQKLVNQMKTAILEVQDSTLTNDMAVKKIAQEAACQADKITKILRQVRAMTQSSHQIIINTSQTDHFIQETKLTIHQSDQTMSQATAEINAVKNTVRETSTKAERLDEFSQEISQTVNLIVRFAAQTHLLALKASVKAARAGEQGKGFAILADEIRSLAIQSAEATAVIETFVNKIQLEAEMLINSVTQSTEHIILGNKFVQISRQNLTKVSQVSSEISKLISSITQAANIQSDTSNQVSQTMVNVATIAQHNSQSANQVSNSIKQLTAVTERIQSDISKFKT